MGPDADKIASRVVSVLWVRLTDDPTSAIEQARSFLDRRNVSLSECWASVGPVENIALSPGVNGLGTARELQQRA